MTKLENCVSDRLNPKSTLICNMWLGECEGKNVKVLNDPKSLMNHFVEKHKWRKIPELAQEDIDNHKPHPKTKVIYTAETYLKYIDENPEQWWFDNQFLWIDIRDLHFLHLTSKGTRSLRSYYSKRYGGFN